MRKFFSFRSSASENRNNDPVPPYPNNEKVLGNTTRESNAKNAAHRKVHGSSKTSKDLVLTPLKQCPRSQDSSGSRLRRSLSFSSPSLYCAVDEENTKFLSDQSRSPSIFSDAQHRAAECPIHYQSFSPERLSKSERHDPAAWNTQTHALEKLVSPGSSRGYHVSSGNSPYCSPVRLRCRTACVTQESKNRILDLYIDGEQQDQNLIGNDNCLAENRRIPCSGRPPRAQCTAPDSPTHSKENLMTCSFREAKDILHDLSTRDWTREDVRHVSPHRYTQQFMGNQSHAVLGRSKMKSQDYDSETSMTTEDIYKDFLDPHLSFTANGKTLESVLSDRDPPCATVESYCSDQVVHCSLEAGPIGMKHEIPWSFGQQEQDSDRELLQKVKEAKGRFMLPDIDIEPERIQNGNICVSTLINMIRNITEDRNNLALELSSQIQCRIAERSSVKEALKQAKIDLDTRTRRLEMEKNELQLNLEKELDRRSSDWSFKLEKFQAEEHRLRERVRELAEQNVSLQREVSSLNGRELETRTRLLTSEMQLNDLTVKMEETREENLNLSQLLTELKDRCCGAEVDRDSVKKSYKEEEKENRELQKAIVRLQRMCSHQESTIASLRQGYSDELGKQSIDRYDHVSRLQMEQVRLTGVEQTLRREVESCRLELEMLRQENICLLDRLGSTENGCGHSLFRLDQELHSRVDFLHSRSFSLLDENYDLGARLLEFVKGKKHEHGKEINVELDGYSFMEFNMKFQSLKREVENLKRSLQTTSAILDTKSSMETSGRQPTTDSGGSRQWENHPSKDDLELELKAETLLSRVLKEKLYSKELEIELVQEEFSSSIRGHEILRSEIQRLQDELSCLTHKAKDMELQIMKKDEKFNQLQRELQECMKELTTSRDILPKVSEERDHLWEEVKQCKETNMHLNYQVNVLKQKIEALDEDILLKEGQITILKDSLANKPFDILYSPNSMKGFALL